MSLRAGRCLEISKDSVSLRSKISEEDAIIEKSEMLTVEPHDIAWLRTED